MRELNPTPRYGNMAEIVSVTGPTVSGIIDHFGSQRLSSKISFEWNAWLLIFKPDRIDLVKLIGTLLAFTMLRLV